MNLSKKIILALIFLGMIMFSGLVLGADESASTTAVSDKSYNLGLVYDGQNLAPQEIVLENLPPQDRRIKTSGGWACRVFGVAGEVLEEFNFFPPAAHGAAIGERIEFDLNVPYHKKGIAAAVFDPQGNLAFSLDTARFADLCGDGICEENENKKSCAADCDFSAKDGANPNLWILAVFALASIVLAAGFVFWKRKPREF